MKILIADESILICSLIKEILKNFYSTAEVFICSSAELIIDTIKKTQPEIIIIDIAGISLNGAKIIQSLNQNQLPKKIIFISQFEDEEYQQKAKKLNGYFLSKKRLENLSILLKEGL